MPFANCLAPGIFSNTHSLIASFNFNKTLTIDSIKFILEILSIPVFNKPIKF
jgi:hypothetical protein